MKRLIALFVLSAVAGCTGATYYPCDVPSRRAELHSFHDLEGARLYERRPGVIWKQVR